jgi:hypothetical protein
MAPDDGVRPARSRRCGENPVTRASRRLCLTLLFCMVAWMISANPRDIVSNSLGISTKISQLSFGIPVLAQETEVGTDESNDDVEHGEDEEYEEEYDEDEDEPQEQPGDPAVSATTTADNSESGAESVTETVDGVEEIKKTLVHERAVQDELRKSVQQLEVDLQKTKQQLDACQTQLNEKERLQDNDASAKKAESVVQEYELKLRTLRKTVEDEMKASFESGSKRRELILDSVRAELALEQKQHETAKTKLREAQSVLLEARQELFAVNEQIRNQYRWYRDIRHYIQETMAWVQSIVSAQYQTCVDHPMAQRYVIPVLLRIQVVLVLIWKQLQLLWEFSYPYRVKIFQFLVASVTKHIPQALVDAINFLTPKYRMVKSAVIQTATPYYQQCQAAIQPHYDQVVAPVVKPYYDQLHQHVLQPLNKCCVPEEGFGPYIHSSLVEFSFHVLAITQLFASSSNSGSLFSKFLQTYVVPALEHMKQHTELYVIYGEGLAATLFVIYVLRAVSGSPPEKNLQSSGSKKTKQAGKVKQKTL